MSGDEWAAWARGLVDEMRADLAAFRKSIDDRSSEIDSRLAGLEGWRADLDESLWSVSKVNGRLRILATLPAIPRRWLIVAGGVALVVIARLGGLDLDLRQLLELLGK